MSASVSQPLWRPLRESDIPRLDAIGEIVHPDLPEPPEVFADRLRICPGGAFVLSTGARPDGGGDEELAGYAIGHPVRLPELPALGQILGALPVGADAFLIHDVALLPQMRGRGLAAPVVELLLGAAVPLKEACLVSVYGTAGFWSRFGFRPETGRLPAGKLASYGPDAVFMTRRL
ncbi:GNAT family N-acetyltransferase [Fulvimarina endophytica]|uniref:GNAT family N-acetyltransferase n=1 Tax=Fulvimarina endophytica TaxID=2293836 RepID=A0A371X5C6_9HYPH|nr:GNAT family N-acetyltransferase [Fulvimarina endophytica]RFC64415.1 GNAT family N-acetyltransferase [Fulvimarina endophytica]